MPRRPSLNFSLKDWNEPIYIPRIPPWEWVMHLEQVRDYFVSLVLAGKPQPVPWQEDRRVTLGAARDLAVLSAVDALAGELSDELRAELRGAVQRLTASVALPDGVRAEG